MTWVVLPNLARLVQEFEGEKEPRLSCFTCHGRDAELVAYAMPRGLPSLDPKHLPDRHSADAREAKLAAFMADEVVPRFANMTHDPNVTCFTCHPKGEER